MAIVMDGHTTNQAMVSELGGSLSPKNIKTSFPHPSDATRPVYIFFDACHMLKLLRNALEAMKEIVIPNVGTARWSDIAKLHELQHTEGLRAANKLTAAHIQFQKQKMKVRLAAQTLSSSVGKALQFLTANKVQGFEDTAGTQKFKFLVDRLFDTFNSRTPKATGFKQALTIKSFRLARPFLLECRELLLAMTDSVGRKVCESRRHLAALGFVMNIDSLLMLGEEILLSNSQFHQSYLLTYKLSQDHLELYFCCIRRMGGWNNNPSARQFAYAYRSLLSRASVSASCIGNVTQQDHTDLLHMSSEEQEGRVEPFEPTLFQNADHDYCTTRRLSLFVNNILEYIAGWVVRKLSAKIACADSLNALVAKADHVSHSESLLEIKNNGGLVKPSADVIAVIQQAEKVLREQVNIQRVVKHDRWGHELENRVLQQIPDDLFADMQEH
jgi:hypothetical protein